MSRFVEGEDRRQSWLLPGSLDDYVTPVRIVEAFIDELDLGALGFAGVQPAVTGRPAYHPSTLLKIYLYGYLNRVQSSRRLERETQRNIELMWLTGRLAPDFKTIASFRKDNGEAIRAVCSQFVVLCRRLNLFTKAVVAIDGSKFKAVIASMLRNSRLYLQQARVSSENHNLECLDGPNTTTEVSFEGRRLTVTAECLDNEGITRSISDLLFSSLPQRPCPTGVTCISTRQGR